MEQNRRKWLKNAGAVLLGLGLSRVSSIAAPMKLISLPHDTAEKIARLSSNENPYGPSAMARAAMAETISLSNRYQWQMIQDLQAAIATKNGLTPGNVLLSAGSTQMIDACVQLAATRKGDLILAKPTFSRWTPAAEKAGLRTIAVPLTADKRHDLHAMLKAVTPDTRMIYICDPNNPTGTVADRSELYSFIKEATKKTLVVVDEAYIDYTGKASVCEFVKENENLLVIRTFSKIYGMAGARVGYALAHNKTIERMGQLQSGANIGVSAVSMAGALASLKDNAFVNDTLIKNERARAYATEEMERLGIHCIPSSSNFIYFSLLNYKIDFFERLRAGNIEGTTIFEEDGKWSRITVGTMEEMQKLISVLG